MAELRPNRRQLLRGIAGFAATPIVARGGAQPPARPVFDPWPQAEEIRSRIVPPRFPQRDFVVTKYGARPDGKTDGTEAFRRAIGECAASGGGRVLVPEGQFLTGAIHLHSGVNLHLAAGATVLFSRDPRAYLPVVFTRWEGVECMNYSPFVYADGQQNIAITGSGTLDGQASCSHWWPWKGRQDCGWKPGQPSQQRARDRLVQMGEQDVPVEQRVFGEGACLRPQFIQPHRCRNVLIQGVTLVNSPMWEIHPVLCRNVTVRNVTVSSHGPNNDGCDPESCSDVLIEGCRFDTGDDCIAIKSGRNRDGRRVNVAAENLVIRGCEMKDGHGGVTIGSEVSGNVRNVFAEDCRMHSPNLERALRIKTNAVRGGAIENIFMRNVKVGQVSDAVIHVDFYYEEGAAGQHLPVVRNIQVQGVTCAKSKYALYLRAFEQAPLTDVTVEQCTFDNVQQPNRIEHVRNLRLREVRINGERVSTAAATGG
jgi:polygalacturonase